MRKGIAGIVVLALCTGVTRGQPTSPDNTALPRAELQLPADTSKANGTTAAPGTDGKKKQLPRTPNAEPDAAAPPRAEVRVPAGADKAKSSRPAAATGTGIRQLPSTLPDPAANRAAPPTAERLLRAASKSNGATPRRVPDRAVLREPAAATPPQDDPTRAPLVLPPNIPGGGPVSNAFAPLAQANGSRFWAEADYLHWWVKSGPVATPLLTAGSPADAIPGALGQPGTQVLVGQSLNYPSMNGYRIGAGFWFDSAQRLGIESHYFDLLQSNWGRIFQSGPGGAILLGRPIVDTTGSFHVLYVSKPGILQGGFSAGSTTQLSGYDINLRGKLLSNEWFNISAIGGFRYFNLAEGLQLVQASEGSILTFNGAALPPGSTIGLTDSIQTRNQFFGGQVGTRLQGTVGRWILGADALLAIGENTQTIAINGQSVAATPGGTVVGAPGGAFAQLSNMGHYSTSHFALVPQFGTDIGFQVTERLRLRLGYNFLFWTNVLRPGAQIDSTLNVNNVPVSQLFGTLPGGPPRPAVLFNRSEFWAQGVSVGLLFSY